LPWPNRFGERTGECPFSAEEAAYIIKNSEATTLIYSDDVGNSQKDPGVVPEIKRHISTGKLETGVLSYEGF